MVRTSPVKVRSPMVYIHAEAPAGAAFDLPQGGRRFGRLCRLRRDRDWGEPLGAGIWRCSIAGEASHVPRRKTAVSCCSAAPISVRARWSGISSPPPKTGSNRPRPIGAPAPQAGKDTPFSMPVAKTNTSPCPAIPNRASRPPARKKTRRAEGRDCDKGQTAMSGSPLLQRDQVCIRTGVSKLVMSTRQSAFSIGALSLSYKAYAPSYRWRYNASDSLPSVATSRPMPR
jgi:hypothetical protein